MKKRFAVNRIALLAVLCAAALIVFTVENLFPSFIVPGAKLGLSNVFTLMCLVLLGNAEGILLVIVKSVLGCLITGNMGALIYSLTAGLVSVVFSACMLSLKKEICTLLAISVGSAVLNNLTQNIVFCLVNENYAMLSLMPYLGLVGILGGASVGLITTLLLKKIPVSVFEKILHEKFE